MHGRKERKVKAWDAAFEGTLSGAPELPTMGAIVLDYSAPLLQRSVRMKVVISRNTGDIPVVGFSKFT